MLKYIGKAINVYYYIIDFYYYFNLLLFYLHILKIPNIFNYSNYTLWMYDPQMLKPKREVLSKKGVKAFNYRSYGGLVLIAPNPRKVKKTKKNRK